MTQTFKDITVLVVDDQPSFRDAVAFEFEMLGCKTISADNGVDALEKFKQHKIDLVISDMRMPVCDGPQFLNALRETNRSHPPFIFMTGFSDLKTYEALDRGADALLGKPINPEELPAIVAKLTTPTGNRWMNHSREKPSHDLKLTLQTIADQSLQIGRNGIFLALDLCPEWSDVKPGSFVQFDIKVQTGPISKLNGIGRIAWLRRIPIDQLEKGYGIEFEYLSDDCRQKIATYITEQEDIRSIPQGRISGKSIEPGSEKKVG